MVTHFVVFAILIVFPLWSGWEYMKVRKSNRTSSKLRLYLLVMAMLWTAAFAILSIMPVDQLFRFRHVITISPMIHIIFFVLFAYFLLSQIIPLLLIARKNEAFLTKISDTSIWKQASYPRNGTERRVFMLLACSVGICEEMIYRAFLPYYLQQEPYVLSVLTSMAVAAVIFALIHFHQGIVGVVQAFFIGFMFSYLFVLSGSLWLVILLHALYDMKVVLISKRLEERGTSVHSTIDNDVI